MNLTLRLSINCYSSTWPVEVSELNCGYLFFLSLSFILSIVEEEILNITLHQNI